MTTSPPPTSAAALAAQALALFRQLKDSGAVGAASSAHGLYKAATSMSPLGTATGAVAVVKSIQNYRAVRDEEMARREAIAADLQGDLAALGTLRGALARHLIDTFDERHAAFEGLFTALDHAQGQGDHAGMAQTLDDLIRLAQASPFKDLREIRRLQASSGFVLEL